MLKLIVVRPYSTIVHAKIYLVCFCMLVAGWHALLNLFRKIFD